jgi:4-diphosphocytidyl-2-C-methyl-D-erythritol kinase
MAEILSIPQFDGMNWRVFAPAKVNLGLHITARRADGYHDLESIVAFASVGDKITYDPKAPTSFDITGPFAHLFSHNEMDATPQSQNLIFKVAYAAANMFGHEFDGRVTLEKNLPLAAGIGGGSADAAAMIRLLSAHWRDERLLEDLSWCAKFGADIPVCVRAKSQFMYGTGSELLSLDNVPRLHALLINPLVPTPTGAIFKALSPPFSASRMNEILSHKEIMTLDYLKTWRNDMQEAAVELCPVIDEILSSCLENIDCQWAQMSGSGATCFAIYDNEESAQSAAQIIAKDHPEWWVQIAIFE